MEVTANQELCNKITQELEQIRPFLQADDGDVTLESVSDDLVVTVKLWGACSSCSMSSMTMQAGVEEAVKRAVPQVRQVVAINAPAEEAGQNA